MSDFVQIAEAKIQKQAYENTVRFNSDIDSFKQNSVLSNDNARLIMKNLHVNNIKGVYIVGKSSYTMRVGNVIELKAFIYRSTDTINIPTIGALQNDMTSKVQWLTNPLSTSVCTVANGIVTATAAGVVSIYVKIASFTSTMVTITVV